MILGFALLAVFVVSIDLVGLALCKAAARADELEEMWEDSRNEPRKEGRT